MKTDAQVYTDLGLLLDGVEVVLTVGIDSVTFDSKSDLLILDEADWHLFDDICQRQVALPKCKGIIGLTATSFNHDYGVEKAFLEREGFWIIDSGIEDTLK